jgi:hypothetical protein
MKMEGKECSSVTESLLSICKALGKSPPLPKTKERKEEGKEGKEERGKIGEELAE